MTILSNSLPMMKSVAESTFSDTCSIHVPTITLTSLGTQSKTWTTTSNIACGFNPDPARKQFLQQSAMGKQQFAAINYDAELRLSLDQSISYANEVTVRDVRYRIDGIQDGSTVKRVTLKRVDANG